MLLDVLVVLGWLLGIVGRDRRADDAPGSLVGTMVDLAVRGYLRIEENPGRDVWDKPDWRLVALPDPAGRARGHGGAGWMPRRTPVGAELLPHGALLVVLRGEPDRTTASGHGLERLRIRRLLGRRWRWWRLLVRSSRYRLWSVERSMWRNP